MAGGIDTVPDRYRRVLGDYMHLYARELQEQTAGLSFQAAHVAAIRYTLTRGFSLNEISQACGLSVSHLQTLLK